MTLTERAKRILELVGKATPAPWTIERYGDDECPSLVMHSDSESRVCFMATPGSHGDPARIKADAKLIRAARNDAPALIRDLLAENAKLRALNATLIAAFPEATDGQ